MLDKLKKLKKNTDYATLSNIRNDLKYSNNNLFLAFEDVFKRVDEIVEKPLKLALMGNFSAGKSSFINRLVGKDILPVGFTPTTPVITVLEYSEKEKVEVVYKYPNGELINEIYQDKDRYEKLKSIQEAKRNDNQISPLKLDKIRVFLKNSLLKTFHIIDTPGFNDAKEMSKETEAIFDKVNFVIWLFSIAEKGDIDKVELETIQKFRGKSEYKNNIYAIVNFSDTRDESALKAFEKNIKKYNSIFNNDKVHFISSKKKDEKWNNKFSELEHDLKNDVLKDDVSISAGQLEEEVDKLHEKIKSSISQLKATQEKMKEQFNGFMEDHSNRKEETINSLKKDILVMIKKGVKNIEEKVIDLEFMKESYSESLLKFSAFYLTSVKLELMREEIEDNFKTYIQNFSKEFDVFKNELISIRVEDNDLRDNDFRNKIEKRLDELSSNLDVLKNTKQILIVGYLIGLLSDDYIYNIIKSNKNNANINEDPISNLLDMDLDLSYFLDEIKKMQLLISEKFEVEINQLKKAEISIKKYRTEKSIEVEVKEKK